MARTPLGVVFGVAVAVGLVAATTLVHAETPLDEIKRLAAEHEPNTFFRVPTTAFTGFTKAEFDLLAPGLWGTMGSTTCIIDAWNGAEISRDGLVWDLTAQGGHFCYGGNEMWRLDLTAGWMHADVTALTQGGSRWADAEARLSGT